MNFKSGYGKPKKYDTKTPYPERKRRHTTESASATAAANQPDFSRMAAFLDTVKDFENSESGIEKLDILMEEMGKRSEPYGVSYMKEQLRLYFDNNVSFTGNSNNAHNDSRY